MTINPVAFIAGASLSALLLVAAHYALKVYPVLYAPWTYVYGVVSCGLGTALYCTLAGGGWDMAIVVFGVFVVAGVFDMAAWGFDSIVETRKRVTGLSREVNDLKARNANR